MKRVNGFCHSLQERFQGEGHLLQQISFVFRKLNLYQYLKETEDICYLMP